MNWIKTKDGLVCLETGAKIYWVKKSKEGENVIFHELRGYKIVLLSFSDMEEKNEIFEKIRTLLKVRDPLNIS